MKDTPKVRTRRVLSRIVPTPQPPVPYAPPAGFPADTMAYLAMLEAGGPFTPEQVKYLQSNAFDIYADAVNSARTVAGLDDAVTVGDKIIAAWRAWREKNPGPPPMSPFFTVPVK